MNWIFTTFLSCLRYYFSAAQAGRRRSRFLLPLILAFGPTITNGQRSGFTIVQDSITYLDMHDYPHDTIRVSERWFDRMLIAKKASENEITIEVGSRAFHDALRYYVPGGNRLRDYQTDVLALPHDGDTFSMIRKYPFPASRPQDTVKVVIDKDAWIAGKDTVLAGDATVIFAKDTVIVTDNSNAQVIHPGRYASEEAQDRPYPGLAPFFQSTRYVIPVAGKDYEVYRFRTYNCYDSPCQHSHIQELESRVLYYSLQDGVLLDVSSPFSSIVLLRSSGIAVPPLLILQLLRQEGVSEKIIRAYSARVGLR